MVVPWVAKQVGEGCLCCELVLYDVCRNLIIYIILPLYDVLVSYFMWLSYL